MRLDLHVHSTASDGTVAPEEVVDRAVAGGTGRAGPGRSRHRGGRSPAPSRPPARERRLHIIPAVEMSSTFEGTDVHILGYFVDIESPAFDAHARRNHERRDARMAEMLAGLERQGIRSHARATGRAARVGRRRVLPPPPGARAGEGGPRRHRPGRVRPPDRQRPPRLRAHPRGHARGGDRGGAGRGGDSGVGPSSGEAVRPACCRRCSKPGCAVWRRTARSAPA